MRRKVPLVHWLLLAVVWAFILAQYAYDRGRRDMERGLGFHRINLNDPQAYRIHVDLKGGQP